MKSFKYYRDRFAIRATRPLPFGLQQALRNLHYELEAAWAHAEGMERARAYATQKGLRLHLGCGPNYKEGWVNVDLGDHVDLALDIRRELPFADDSCKIIYSEHVFEHIDYPQPALSLLAELYRVLEPGGTLSLAVPDAEMVLNAYVLGASQEYYDLEARINPRWCETRMQHVNFEFRQNSEHRFYYDFETLALVLQRAGFVAIERREFDPALDQEMRRLGSLYVAANKPAPA